MRRGVVTVSQMEQGCRLWLPRISSLLILILNTFCIPCALGRGGCPARERVGPDIGGVHWGSDNAADLFKVGTKLIPYRGDTILLC